MLRSSVSPVLFAFAVSACGSSTPATSTPAASESLTIECDPLVKGANVLVAPGSITLFGEMHGTTEVPAMVANLACNASASAPIVVGLEIPETMNAALAGFLNSDGGETARAALLANSFWQTKDGRGSHAMLGLIASLRALRAAGRQVSVFGFDGTFASAELRDKGMAEHIVARLHAVDSQAAVTLLLTGNLHARTNSERWMGWHLRRAFSGLRSLNNSYSGGSAWVCTRDGCGAMDLRGHDSGSDRFVEINAAVDDYGYNGSFYLGSVSASSPAIGPMTVTPLPRPTASARSKANAAYEAKSFGQCEGLYAESAERAGQRAKINDLYNAACCAALAGKSDKAFTHLQASVDAGYRDAAHLAKDSDLASLRDDPRWPAIVAAAEEKARNRLKGSNAELAALYAKDQGDRQAGPGKIDWTVVSERDAKRRARVGEILKAGGAKTSIDYHHAAMVFQHSDKTTDYQLAHELALKAVELDSTNESAKWLAAAAKDRFLMSSGKPQLYGTQFRKVDGVWVLYKVDPTMTDEERAKWNVPPIAEARSRAEQMNKR